MGFDMSREHIRKIKVPVPHWDIQEKIAEFLDRIRISTENIVRRLKEEIKAREKQYECCRDLILTNMKSMVVGGDEKTVWKRIDEIATEISVGRGIVNKETNSGDSPCVSMRDVSHQYDVYFSECLSKVDSRLIENPKYVNYGDVVVASLGNAGKSCVYLGIERAIAGNGIIVISHNQNHKYLAYALSSDVTTSRKAFLIQKTPLGATIFPQDLRRLKVLLPPLRVQEEVVKVLDKLRLHKHELIKRLREEIESREKQYEYYRDLIITRTT